MAEKEKANLPVEGSAPAAKKADAAKDKKAVKASKKPAKEQKKKGWMRGLGSELKKVTWPGFGKTVKQTGIVLGVTLFFLVIVTAIDAGLGAIYKSLLDQWGDTATSAVSSLLHFFG